jgi:uncharacterized protein with PhoU and TrkA domain
MKKKGTKRRSIFGRLQKTPKWQAEEFTEIEYQPTTVKELLIEMKNISELIIDLAYSAILFDSDDIAEEVKYLEVRMDKLNYDIRMIAMLAVRTKEGAEQLAGILQVAEAAESISNAAGDIAKLLSYEEKTRPILPKILRQADEKLYRLEVADTSSACDQIIGNMRIESETGMRIIAIRRGDCWIYNPQSETNLRAKDWLIVRGTEDGFEDLRNFITGKTRKLE